jgi:YD repeat-containing protein
MMKLIEAKKSILFLFVYGVCLCQAQDIQPGNMTTALSEVKAASSVDYTTGTFNYNFPLFDIKQDNIHLPVNLSYTAKGIKVGQMPGVAGLGWSLSSGACTISRTMRGSGPDENGILVNPITDRNVSYPRNEDEYIKDVNGNLQDAESDLFTLNLGGKIVKFVLENNDDGSYHYIARPLEQTDIKIECSDPGLYHFTVTDNEGNVYELDGALPSNVIIKGAGPAGSQNIACITSWVTTKITTSNNREISFEYDREYADISDLAYMHYTGFNQPMQLPPIAVGDQDLQGRIATLSYKYNVSNDVVSGLLQQFNAGIDLIRSMTSSLNWSSSGNTLNDYVNESMISAYEHRLDEILQSSNWTAFDAYLQQQQLDDLIREMYTGIRMKYHDYEAYDNLNYFANKLVKKIAFPGGAVSFKYKTILTASDAPGGDSIYVCNRVDYTNAAGDILRSVVLDINNAGYLKKLTILNAGQQEEQNYQFDYYGNNDCVYCWTGGGDYWGYFNGKGVPGTAPLPADFIYEVSAQHGYDLYKVSIFDDEAHYAYQYDYNAGFFDTPDQADSSRVRDLTPDAQAAVNASLRTISSSKGEKVNLEYEGNSIYSEDIGANIAIGGIRIKSIEVNDGVSSNPLKTSYRYDFPYQLSRFGESLLKSSGRLCEWGKKAFAVLYDHNLGSDLHVFSQPIYKGTLCDDNSNNGVLYHYVEEVHTDQSYTGYKYLAVEDYSQQMFDHNPMYDNALLAAVDFNASGKIVKIVRNQYAYGAGQGGGVGNRNDEYNLLQAQHEYFTTDGARNTEHLVEQIKKEPVYMRSTTVENKFSDNVVSGTNVAGRLYSFNPHRDVYLPNYQPRCDVARTPNKYFLTTNQTLLLKEKEEYYIGDYDPANVADVEGYPELSEERAYLYERILQSSTITKVQHKTSFYYDNPAYTYATKTSETTSDGSAKTTYFKYPQDMTDPISQAMVTKHILSPVLEQKAYQLNNGVETLLSTIQNSYRQEGALIVADQIKTSVTGGTLQTKMQFNSYDAYGNILEKQSANGVKEVYLWGYNAEYPVAKIVGADYNTAKGFVDQTILDNVNNAYADDQVRAELTKLRNNLPGAQVMTYTYKPLVGVTSETDPNGNTTYYEYDSFGRLVCIKDKDKNIIKKICYTYSGQAENCN